MIRHRGTPRKLSAARLIAAYAALFVIAFGVAYLVLSAVVS